MAHGGKRHLPPLRFPWRGSFHLLNVKVPARTTSIAAHEDQEGCILLDVTIGKDGKIQDVAPAGALALRHTLVQGHGRQLWPAFADMHVHLDKTATWDRAPNRDGTFDGALNASRDARALPWSADDVFLRMDEAVTEAFVMGVSAIRTHIDSMPQRLNESWRAFARVQTKWHDRMALQGVVLCGAASLMTSDGERLANLAAERADALGPAIYPSDELDANIARCFELAERRRLDLDFHVDETHGVLAHGLDRIADFALSRKFQGSIVCGHACSLSLHDDARAKATIEKLVTAKIGVVSLPSTNLYLQARQAGTTPAWRGVTRLHELRAHGVTVAVAGDNRQDAFYPFGDYDMLDVFRDAVRIAHLDMPMAGWVDSVSTGPASLMGLRDVCRIEPGARADFVVFPVRTAVEVLAQRGLGRQVVRNGRAI